MPDKPTMLLMTVENTGSQYFHEGLKNNYNVILDHFHQETIKKIKDQKWDYIATTYRDPLLVGASWANRDKISGKRWENLWFAVWGLYSFVLDIAGVKVFHLDGKRTQHGVTFSGEVVGSTPDTYSMYKALKENNMDSYYERCPIIYIEYANYCSRKIRHYA